MHEILFYHLSESPPEHVLPPLLMRSLERGWNVAIQCPTEESCRRIDSFLWSFSEQSFLPHGTEADAYPQEQPVLLSLSDANQNKAHVCFSVEGAVSAAPQNFARFCLIFDGGNAEQLQTARAAWKKWQAAEKDGEKLFSLTYWQQTAQKKWEKKG